MPSRWALLRIAVGGLPSFKLITPVGVLPLARGFSSLTSSGVQGSRICRLYLGLAFRGPFLPMGDPGFFHAGVFATAASIALKLQINQPGRCWFPQREGQAG